MRISRGIGCSFGSCGCVLLFSVVLAGCLVQPGKTTPKPGTTIEQMSFEACQARDRAVADALEHVATRIDAGELQYDATLQAELTKCFLAGDQTAEEKRVSAAMAKVLTPGQTFDTVATSKALRQLAAGRRRAGK